MNEPPRDVLEEIHGPRVVAFIRTYVTYVELFGKVKSNRKRGSPPVRLNVPAPRAPDPVVLVVPVRLCAPAAGIIIRSLCEGRAPSPRRHRARVSSGHRGQSQSR